MADLVRAYDSALHQRHKDVTDYALNRGCEVAFWEPSSTVTLAADKLRQDGRTVEQRWREFFAQSRRPAPAATAEPVPQMARLEAAYKRRVVENSPLAGSPVPTPEQLLRFLERRGLSLEAFQRMSWQLREGYMAQCLAELLPHDKPDPPASRPPRRDYGR